MDALIRDFYDDLNPEAFSDCESQTPRSRSCLDCFKNQYFYGNEISYDCEEKRKLYLLRYFAVHCAENYRGSTNIPSDVIDGWFEDGAVKILSVGGGPGSDICGVLRYLEEECWRRQTDLSIDVVRVDIEDEWDEIFDDVIERLFPWCEDYQKVRLDVKEGLKPTLDSDFNLVTASYLTSELSTETCLNLADDIDSVLIDGGVLMINDRPEDVIEQDIRSMLDQIDMSYEERFLTDWAGYSYPNDISNAVYPKFKMNSRIFIGVKR